MNKVWIFDDECPLVMFSENDDGLFLMDVKKITDIEKEFQDASDENELKIQERVLVSYK